MSWKAEAREIISRKKMSAQQGGKDAVTKQHSKGRLTIRERIEALLDEASFEEIGQTSGTASYDDNGKLVSFDPANFLLGFGKIAGRRVIVGGEDFTLKGGSPSPSIQTL